MPTLPWGLPFVLGDWPFNYGDTAGRAVFPAEVRSFVIPVDVRSSSIEADRRTA